MKKVSLFLICAINSFTYSAQSSQFEDFGIVFMRAFAGLRGNRIDPVRAMYRFPKPQWPLGFCIYSDNHWNPTESNEELRFGIATWRPRLFSAKYECPITVRSKNYGYQMFLTVQEGLTLQEFMDDVIQTARDWGVPGSETQSTGHLFFTANEDLPTVFTRHFLERHEILETCLVFF